jgi:uncharacterized protein
MGLIRIILIAGIVWLLLVFIQKLRQARQSGQDQDEITVAKKQMVQCAYCSVYVPKDNALRNNDDYFCCSNHMEINHK